MVLFILWAFFIGDMSPQPIQLGSYSTLKECEQQRLKVKKEIHWDRWNFVCISD